MLEQLAITWKKNTDLKPFIKINSQWAIDLNVKHKSIKLQEDNIGENLEDPRFGDNVLDMTPKAGESYTLEFILRWKETLKNLYFYEIILGAEW